MDNITLDKVDKSEHPILLQIWEASVRATHHFLSEEDILFYKTFIQENQVFDLVHLISARNGTNDILGFIGVAGEKLELLFLRPDVRGKGIGVMLLKHAVEELKIKTVEVNEQNEQASGFYAHFGFQVASRSELDGTGKPYPILQMKLI